MNNFVRIYFFRFFLAAKTFFGKNVSFLEMLISKKYKKDFFYIQIGANDGKKWDPIFRMVNSLKLNGIALEPVKDIFDALKRNYRNNPQVKLINKAIHAKDAEAIIYRVNPVLEDVPNWTEGTGSFFIKHHELSGFSKSQIIEEKVTCIHFNDLLKQEGVSKLDLLQIDTEGYDFEIIYSIDFSIVKPSILSFEHGVKSNIHDSASLLEMINYLSSFGYKFWFDDFDMVAYL